MATSTDDQRIHTYLDDIKFQAVKGNNKRTSFVSSDHQILSKNAQVLKSIEKTEKLVSADFRRQQNALLKNLDRLQTTREKSMYFSGAQPDDVNNNIFSRRHSAPCLEKTFISRQNSTVSTSPTHGTTLTNKKLYSNANRERKLSNSSLSNRERKMSNASTTERQFSNSSEGGDSHCSRDSMFDDVNNAPFSRQSSTGSQKMSIVDARRLSHDIQEETSKMAMERIEQIVKGHNKRRATIAEGATPHGVLMPSSELLSRLSRADCGSDVDD